MINAFFFCKSEEVQYTDSVSTRVDVREFLENAPQSGALKTGGWIAIAVGLVMLATGGGFWLWG